MTSQRHLFYAMPGPPIEYQIVESPGCQSEACNRIPCVASDAKHSRYCCPKCHETAGSEHSPACDKTWASPGYKELTELQPGDKLDMHLPSEHLHLSRGRICQIYVDVLEAVGHQLYRVREHSCPNTFEKPLRDFIGKLDNGFYFVQLYNPEKPQ